MTTTLSSRGQTVIPSEIRHRYGLKENSKLAWVDDGKQIIVVPIPDDPANALCGAMGKGPSLAQALLKERAREREKDLRQERHLAKKNLS